MSGRLDSRGGGVPILGTPTLGLLAPSQGGFKNCRTLPRQACG